MTDVENACPCHSAPLAQSDLIGCWKLVEALWERDGRIQTNPNLGDNPVGYLHYLAEGRVAVTIALAGRKPMSGAHRRTAPPEELAESALTFDAYAGKFSLQGADRIVHHIEISSYQNDVGRDLVRRVVLEGNRLSLYPIEFQDDGRRWLVWERMPLPR